MTGDGWSPKNRRWHIETPRLFLFVGHRDIAAQWPKDRLGQRKPWQAASSPGLCVGYMESLVKVRVYVEMYITNISYIIYIYIYIHIGGIIILY